MKLVFFIGYLKDILTTSPRNMFLDTVMSTTAGIIIIIIHGDE